PTVVVENRPGGGTVIGTEAVERAEPDGRTVLLVANSFVINPPLQRASYNPTTSFDPVCYLAATPMVLVVLGSSPYRTLNDLITAARAKPGELAFASGGPGSSLHIPIEVLKRAANLNITYVPYGGTAPAINALMGNHVAAVVGRLSHRGVAAAGRDAARARHHLESADRDAAGCADAGRDRRQQIRGGDLLRHRGPGEDADRRA